MNSRNNYSQGNQNEWQQQHGGHHRLQHNHQQYSNSNSNIVDNANRRHQGQFQQQFQQQQCQETLPPGWVEAMDPNTGKTYYCNPQTGDTKWERPSLSVTNTIPQAGPTETSMRGRVFLQQQQKQLPPGWVEAKDPSSGNVYYCNPQTRETRWERPVFSSLTPSTTPPVETHSNRSTPKSLVTDPTKDYGHRNRDAASRSSYGGGTNQAATLPTAATPASTTPESTTQATQNTGGEDGFDELLSFTTGQIAHLIIMQHRKQKEELSALAEEERQVDLSTIVTINKDENHASALNASKYTPIQLSMISMPSGNERTEPGRLDVRMHALREELKKFGYQPTQPYA